VVETPALLQRSGVGPASILDPLCIKKQVVNEHVGRHALTHGGFQITYWVEETSFNPAAPDSGAIESLTSLNAMIPNDILTSGLHTYAYPIGYAPERAIQILST
jgi:hypothetical protein